MRTASKGRMKGIAFGEERRVGERCNLEGGTCQKGTNNEILWIEWFTPEYSISLSKRSALFAHVCIWFPPKAE